MVDLSRTHTERFNSTFIVRTVKLWNPLAAFLLPHKYNLLVKSRFSRYLLGDHVLPYTASSLHITTRTARKAKCRPILKKEVVIFLNRYLL